MTADSRTRRASTESDSVARSDRSATADAERLKDDSGVSPETKRRLNLSEFTQEALPTAPPIPGFHTCWLALNSSWDPLHKRLRMGYVPVKAEEAPELASFRMKSGEYEGVVGCNEMVLFKIPMDLYAQIMREYHHDAPMREEESLRSQLKRSDRDSNGNELGMIEGFEDIGAQPRRAPHFA